MAISLLAVSGPVMVGPSSSHTAGALKIGKLARSIYDQPIQKVRIYLHGSFAEVSEGHATDRAIIAGLLEMDTTDSRIKTAFEEAKKTGMKYEFIKTDLGSKYHPNTARIEIIKKDGTTLVITGSSIGGGAIKLTGINQFFLNFREPVGDTFTLIITHQDRSGVLGTITGILTTEKNNIASIYSKRSEKGGDAITIVETDEDISSESLKELKNTADISSVFIMK